MGRADDHVAAPSGGPRRSPAAHRSRARSPCPARAARSSGSRRGPRGRRRLDRSAGDERQVRDAVRDDLDAARVDAVAVASSGAAEPGHDDGRVDAAIELGEDLALAGRRGRAGPCAASRRPGRRAPDEVEDGLAVLAAPDPVLVLDRDDVDARAEGRGGARVVGALVAPDAVVDLERVGRRRAPAGAGRRSRDRRSAAARSWVKVAMPQRRGG